MGWRSEEEAALQGQELVDGVREKIPSTSIPTSKMLTFASSLNCLKYIHYILVQMSWCKYTGAKAELD